jgi:hypothetical protein
VAVLPDDGADASRRVGPAAARAMGHMGAARGGGPPAAAVAAAVSERAAGLGQQPRRDCGAGRGPGLAHPPSGLVSGDGQGTT